MRNIFIILGYGIPKNIRRDTNYQTYLSIVFNTIYAITQKTQDIFPLIIFSGGPTDCFPPYQRIESKEMSKLFFAYAKQYGLNKVTARWKYVFETKSLSTTENFKYIRDTFVRRKISSGNLTIFGETTRTQRIIKTAKWALNKKFHMRFCGIDFDISKNRYNTALIKKRERSDTRGARDAFANIKYMQEHHALMTHKFKVLRQAGPKHQSEALQRWWNEQCN